MRILIPELIRLNINSIETLLLEIAPNIKNCVPKFVSVLVPISEVASSEWVGLHDKGFEGSTTIQYRVSYKNGTTEIFRFSNKDQSVFKPNNKTPINYLKIKYKTSESFEPTLKGQTEILFALDQRIQNTNNLTTTTKGNKNLVYYTVYFNNGYIELLNDSIESLLNYSSVEFDILIITDEETKTLIETQPFVQKITPKYHITSTPLDGVEASINKTKVFEYSNIDSYDKILFMDCDVIAIKDVSNIFNLELNYNTLYTAYNLNLTYRDFKTLYHGFEFLTDNFVQEMEEAKQMPFNAGQFIFRNSKQMRSHFDNLNWMINNWNGEYFFEQCFMNYYFCKAHITESTLLQNCVSVINTIDANMKYNMDENTCLVHFIAPPLDAKSKLIFIKNFIKTFYA